MRGAAVIQPVHARAASVMGLNFGDRAVVTYLDGRPDCVSRDVDLVGLQTYRRAQIHIQGNIDSFIILFQPAALNRLFSLPMHEFTNDDFDAQGVVGPMISHLYQRLGDCNSFEERVAIVDEFLLHRALAADCLDGVTWAANQLLSRAGRARIPALADRAGLSLRQFERRFTQQVGMAPKMFARIARLEAVIDRMARSSTESWTTVAHRFGYFDQMHMVHDFVEFTGEPPRKALHVVKEFFRDELDVLQSDQDLASALRETRLII